MSSSVSLIFLSVACLILVQNSVYTQTVSVPPAVQVTKEPTKPVVAENPTVTAQHEDKTEEATEKTNGEPTKPEATKTDSTSPTTTAPVSPSAHAQGENKPAGGTSSTIYANFGMLLVTASVLMRL